VFLAHAHTERLHQSTSEHVKYKTPVRFSTA
jgi:hypothetical protein